MNEKIIQTVALEEIWKKNANGYLPLLLEIYNPDLVWNDNSLDQENMYLRVIANTNAVTYQGKRYIPARFEFTMPEEDGKTIGNASLTISAIDSRVVQMLRSIEVASEVTIVAAFAINGTTVQFCPLETLKLKMNGVSYNRTTAQFNLVFKDVLKLNVPRDIATKDRTPSVNANA